MSSKSKTKRVRTKPISPRSLHAALGLAHQFIAEKQIENYVEPRVARNRCYITSDDFLRDYAPAIKKLGFKGRLVCNPYHYFVRLKRGREASIAVDLTFRQFNGISPFPLVLDEKTYRKKWLNPFSG